MAVTNKHTKTPLHTAYKQTNIRAYIQHMQTHNTHPRAQKNTRLHKHPQTHTHTYTHAHEQAHTHVRVLVQPAPRITRAPIANVKYLQNIINKKKPNGNTHYTSERVVCEPVWSCVCLQLCACSCACACVLCVVCMCLCAKRAHRRGKKKLQKRCTHTMKAVRLQARGSTFHEKWIQLAIHALYTE